MKNKDALILNSYLNQEYNVDNIKVFYVFCLEILKLFVWKFFFDTQYKNI